MAPLVAIEEAASVVGPSADFRHRDWRDRQRDGQRDPWWHPRFRFATRRGRRQHADIERIAHGYATLGTIGFEGRFDYAL
jgi:hypothetical protein